jgi:hypothetical protein
VPRKETPTGKRSRPTERGGHGPWHKPFEGNAASTQADLFQRLYRSCTLCSPVVSPCSPLRGPPGNTETRSRPTDSARHVSFWHRDCFFVMESDSLGGPGRGPLEILISPFFTHERRRRGG